MFLEPKVGFRGLILKISKEASFVEREVCFILEASFRGWGEVGKKGRLLFKS